MKKQTPQDCKQAQRAWVEYQELEAAGKAPDWQTFVARFPGCQEELEAMRSLWVEMGRLPAPEPGPRLQARFQRMLAEQREQMSGELGKADGLLSRKLTAMRNALAQWLSGPRLAYALLVFLLGIAGGYWLGAVQPTRQQVTLLARQVQEMRELTFLTMLQQPSASDRLKAVTISQELERIDAKVIDALLHTLNHDPNVNVRLATIEALLPKARSPEVRAGMIAAINQQGHPLVQLALAEAMVKLNEKASVPALQELLEKPETIPDVQQKVESSIQVLL